MKWLKNISPASLKLNLTVVSETLLLLVVSLAVMMYFSLHAIKQEAMQDAEQTLAGTVQNIDNLLLSIEQTSDNVYHEMLDHLNQPERMENYCRKIVESNPYVIGCAIVFKPYFYKDRELFMAYVHRQESMLVSSESFGPKPYTEQAWFTEPMKTGRACWTDPFKDENMEGESLTTFCLPIYVPAAKKGGKEAKACVGVLAVDLSISLLSQVILSSKSSSESYSVLLGSNGIFMVHPDTKKLKRQSVFTLIEDGNPTIKEAAEEMMAGQTGHKAVEINGKDYYVFYQPFSRGKLSDQSIDQLNWSVGEVFSADDMLGAYYQLIYAVVAIAIMSLIIFFVLCRRFVRKELQPLRLLIHSANRITKGDYSEPVPATDREDEIGQLQYRFRRMQQSLAAHVKELEQLKTSLQDRSMILQKTSGQTLKNDKVKSAFLHYVSDQMIIPGDLIDKSITKLCNNYPNMSEKEMEEEMGIIKKQSNTILQLLGQIIQTIQIESGKEDSDE
jgi:methyl-accepting chemotaxis protein/sigma-B regulation protein RsbU (phosphoserine phosphatase)